MNDYIVPINHVGFKAKKINKKIDGRIIDSSIAYIEPDGGGPEPSHIHEHDHYFIVLEGCATIRLDNRKIIINSEESMVVKGSIIHSVWNEGDSPLKMIGINIEQVN